MLIRDLAFSRPVLPAILDLWPIEKYIDDKMYELLLGLDIYKVVELF